MTWDALGVVGLLKEVVASDGLQAASQTEYFLNQIRIQVIRVGTKPRQAFRSSNWEIATATV